MSLICNLGFSTKQAFSSAVQFLLNFERLLVQFLKLLPLTDKNKFLLFLKNNIHISLLKFHTFFILFISIKFSIKRPLRKCEYYFLYIFKKLRNTVFIYRACRLGPECVQILLSTSVKLLLLPHTTSVDQNKGMEDQKNENGRRMFVTRTCCAVPS